MSYGVFQRIECKKNCISPTSNQDFEGNSIQSWGDIEGVQERDVSLITFSFLYSLTLYLSRKNKPWNGYIQLLEGQGLLLEGINLYPLKIKS